MEKLNQSIFITLLLSFFHLTNLTCQEQVLRDYIIQGLKENKVLRNKKLEDQKNLHKTREAFGKMLPQISASGHYNWNDGGREIHIPVGDIFTAYTKHNQQFYPDLGLPQSAQPGTGESTSSNGFENMSVPFLRSTDVVGFVRVEQALFYSGLLYNYKIQKFQKKISVLDERAYQNTLITEIKRAYFDYLRAIEIEKLFHETHLIIEENIRVNKRLFETTRVTIEKVYRAESDLAELNQQMADARKQKLVAQAYFNYLLNRPLETAIIADDYYLNYEPLHNETILDIDEIEAREELLILKEKLKLTNSQIKLNRSSFLPIVSASYERGLQGTSLKYNAETADERDYSVISLNFRWLLFSGLQNHHRVQQAKISAMQSENQYDDLKQKLEVDLVNSFYDLEAAMAKMEAAAKQVISSREVFRTVTKKYENSMSSQLEYLDARSNMTSAGLSLIIDKYNYYSRQADYELKAGLVNADTYLK
jgi:outer membrane protein